MSDSTGLAPASAQDPVRRLEADLRREQKKVALVQEVSRALSGPGDLDSLLALILKKVTELMEADRSTLFVLTDDGKQLLSRMSGGSRVEIRLDLGEGIAGWVAQTREIVNIPDAYADKRFQPAVDHKSGYRTRSILTVPMLGAQGGLVGVLQVLNKQDGPFTQADEELLVALASQAAIAIENAKLYHSLLQREQLLLDLIQRAELARPALEVAPGTRQLLSGDPGDLAPQTARLQSVTEVPGDPLANSETLAGLKAEIEQTVAEQKQAVATIVKDNAVMVEEFDEDHGDNDADVDAVWFAAVDAWSRGIDELDALKSDLQLLMSSLESRAGG